MLPRVGSRRRAATTTDTVERSRSRRRSRAHRRRAGHRRHRHARGDLSRDRPREERELHVADRPSAARDLEAALARPVRLANDANCFALSEAIDGAAAGAEMVFGVIVGTGTRRRRCRRRPRLAGAERHRRRMGTQPASLAGRRGAARAAVLLRQARMHRDVPQRAGHGAGPRSARPATRLDSAGDRRAGQRRRCRLRRRRSPAMAAHGEGAGDDHQRPRSGRHRAGRRDVENRPALRAGAEAAA